MNKVKIGKFSNQVIIAWVKIWLKKLINAFDFKSRGLVDGVIETTTNEDFQISPVGDDITESDDES